MPDIDEPFPQITKAIVDRSHVEIRLSDGVIVGVTANRNSLNLHFSGVESCEAKDRCANGMNVEYKKRT